MTGSLDTEPFSRLLLGVEGTEEDRGDGEEGGLAPRTAISSVAVRQRLRRLSLVSGSTTSNLVSFSTAFIRWTTCKMEQMDTGMNTVKRDEDSCSDHKCLHEYLLSKLIHDVKEHAVRV